MKWTTASWGNCHERPGALGLLTITLRPLRVIRQGSLRVLKRWLCICLIIPWLKATPCLQGPCRRRCSHDFGDSRRQLVKAALIQIFPQRGQGVRLLRLANPCLGPSGCHLATMTAIIFVTYLCCSCLPRPPADLTLFPLGIFFPFKSRPHLR